MATERYPLFDSLRAVAALSIVFFHSLFQPSVLDGASEELWRFGRNLDVGVPIFFGITGFLLYRPFVRARAEGRPLPSLRRYGTRRVLRIVPAYWVALVVVTIWLDLPETRSIEGAARYFLFAQVYDPDTAVLGIGQAWSLDAEAVFYVLLPVWAWWMFRSRMGRNGELAGLAIVFAGGLAWQVLALSNATPGDPRGLTWLLTFPNWIDHLAIGMTLAVLSVRGGQPGWWSRTWLMWGAAAVLWLACGAFAGGHAVTDDAAYLARHLLFGGVVLCALAPAVFGQARPNRLLGWIGTVSYSLYLIHLAVLGQMLLWWERLPDGAEWLVWTAQMLAGSLAAAAVGYYLVERPFVRLGRFRRTAQEHAAP